MPDTNYLIRLLEINDDGDIESLDQDYSMEEFCNSLPMPGDCIVSPWVPGKLDRFDPANRTVYDVVKRYFMPETIIDTEDERYIYVGLVVRSRKAGENERSVCRT